MVFLFKVDAWRPRRYAPYAVRYTPSVRLPHPVIAAHGLAVHGDSNLGPRRVTMTATIIIGARAAASRNSPPERGKVPLSDEVAMEDGVRNSGRGSGDTTTKLVAIR